MNNDNARKEVRQINLRRRNECQRALHRLPLQAELKNTLQYVLDNIGSASDYTLAWPSQKTIARTLGIEDRNTVGRHLNKLAKLGLIIIARHSIREARRMLLEQFGYQLKGDYGDRLNFYAINYAHPFWQGEDVDVLMAQSRGMSETETEKRRGRADKRSPLRRMMRRPSIS
jgi:DNA-binding MarR family transcriptional regulator